MLLILKNKTNKTLTVDVPDIPAPFLISNIIKLSNINILCNPIETFRVLWSLNPPTENVVSFYNFFTPNVDEFIAGNDLYLLTLEQQTSFQYNPDEYVQICCISTINTTNSNQGAIILLNISKDPLEPIFSNWVDKIQTNNLLDADISGERELSRLNKLNIRKGLTDIDTHSWVFNDNNKEIFTFTDSCNLSPQRPSLGDDDDDNKNELDINIIDDDINMIDVKKNEVSNESGDDDDDDDDDDDEEEEEEEGAETVVVENDDEYFAIINNIKNNKKQIFIVGIIIIVVVVISVLLIRRNISSSSSSS
jgi:hypothetical protein